jgi:type IV secretion system protein VirB8
VNELSREAMDAYYAEAASWNRDRVQAARTSLRVAWWIAAVAAAIALFEARSSS